MRLIPWLEEPKTIRPSKFWEAQKAFIAKQGSDGVPVAEHLPGGWDKSGDLLHQSATKACSGGVLVLELLRRASPKRGLLPTCHLIGDASRRYLHRDGEPPG